MNALQLVSMNEDPVALPEIVIVPATPAHIRELSQTIREKDRAEIENYGFSCAKGLWRSYKQGLNNQTALINGKVAACWGVCGVYLGDVGQPWLLTSEEVYKISPLRFARIYQREVYAMLEVFSRLENYVCASYPEAIRLLSIIGFTIGEPEKLGNGNYRHFVLERYY